MSEFDLPEYRTPPDPEFWLGMSAQWAAHIRFCREVADLMAALDLSSEVDYADGTVTAETEAVACDMKRRRDLRRS
jgi:hypothetical protein